MPKSKRNKVVALTKVKKRPKDKKDKLIEEIRDTAGKFSNCFLLSIENERNAFLQVVRSKLRPGKLICAKNKVMQLALGTTPASECQDNIHEIATRISGPCGLLFTDQKHEEVAQVLADYRPVDYARSGAIATETVKLEKGLDALARLPHSIEHHLRQLGLPTQLRDGKIHLLGDHEVCTKDKELTSDTAQVLKLLEIKQAQFLMSIEARWTRGGKFEDTGAMED
eukprot:CAMPEP_0168437960 /NCGR_PEP_ID=MMETSP0228-20121227/41714_1 /TAXON_ID=133427 /ORGANISM="Protoceratium reticulatum, Strain CCCM 535 (=CCMP 1889)" /LENGTH=224 /DNA_ID=CAMNT_0008452211 /DNA_START=57 /DNA_END=731 /DNA_ORIENTATION=+